MSLEILSQGPKTIFATSISILLALAIITMPFSSEVFNAIKEL